MMALTTFESLPEESLSIADLSQDLSRHMGLDDQSASSSEDLSQESYLPPLLGPDEQSLSSSDYTQTAASTYMISEEDDWEHLQGGYKGSAIGYASSFGSSVCGAWESEIMSDELEAQFDQPSVHCD